MKLLIDKVAVVTGATGGIGTEIVRAFLDQGATVIGLARHEKKIFVGAKYFHKKLDVVKTAECEKVINEIYSEFGKIDVLVNCAGITRDAMTKTMNEGKWDEVIDVNLKGTWNVTRCVGPKMQVQKCGSIINISSIVGVFGNIGQANYAATKAGVIGMTKSWAKEFALKGGNVRVNAVAPGYTMTSMLETVPQHLLDQFASQTMLGRLARPDEIANTVLFLASDMSSYITGETINVNGGMRL
jgi:3-oxoacyl-[acyl-carrier protein] reductase